MPGWVNSDRRDRLPPEWPQMRLETLKAAGWKCQHKDAYGARCNAQATDVDHVEPGDDHRPQNRQALCAKHHGSKSGREGAWALAAKRRKINQRFRRTEVHPGQL